MWIEVDFVTNDGPAEGLTPALTANAFSDDSVALNAVTMSEIGNGRYKYDFSTADNDEDYSYYVDGGATLTGKGRYAYGNSGIVGQVTEIKTKTDNQPAGIQKNVALSNFPFRMIDSSDHVSPLEDKTVTGVIKKDDGAWASLANTPSYDDNCIYLIDFSQSEMNGDVITAVLSAAGCDDTVIILKTST